VGGSIEKLFSLIASGTGFEGVIHVHEEGEEDL
jgi:hypothetical protein